MSKVVDGFWWLVESVAGWCLKILFKILHKELTPEIEENFLQLVRFCVVGVSNTFVSYAILMVSLLAIKATGLNIKYDYVLANGISFVLGVAWSFFWNNKYVFVVGEGEKRSIFKALLRSYVSYSFTSLFLSSVLLIVWVQGLGISEFVAPFINLIVTVPINFLVNKFWAFKKEER